jgi:hypothetical protein
VFGQRHSSGGHQPPEDQAQSGEGGTATFASEQVMKPLAAYHLRVVAASGLSGPIVSPDAS